MISTLLHLLRLFPFLFGGHRQIALEKNMGIRGSGHGRPQPVANPFAEWLIGSVRRESLDHVFVLAETHLCCVLPGTSRTSPQRTHLSLDKDAPDVRPVAPPELGPVVQIPEVGGLHHRYVGRAA